MKKLATIAVMFLIVSPVICSEVNGTWIGTIDGIDSEKLEVTYGFKADGKTLTGFIKSSLGGRSISDGKIDGNNIEFRLNAGEVTIMNNGTISGNEIHMTQTVGTEKTKYVLKRGTYNPGTTSGPGITTITKPK